MIYIVDSCCFMKPFRVTYPMDIAESFWNKVAELANNHKFYSIDKVKDEIFENSDELTSWCKAKLPQDFFISTETEEFYGKFGEIVTWAQNRNIKQMGIDKFIDDDKADIYIVTMAALAPEMYTVVTEETSAPKSKKDIKLPDACSAFNIRCINFIEMLRELSAKF